MPPPMTECEGSGRWTFQHWEVVACPECGHRCGTDRDGFISTHRRLDLVTMARLLLNDADCGVQPPTSDPIVASTPPQARRWYRHHITIDGRDIPGPVRLQEAESPTGPWVDILDPGPL